MHRKSLEAAETLKNSDEGSDKEESKTEESDGSVISNLSKAPSASPKCNTNNNSSSTNNNSSTTSNSTVSPTSAAQARQQQQQQQAAGSMSMGGAAHHSPPLPHHMAAQQHHPGGSPMDSARQDYNSSTSPSNSNRSYPSLHDTDSEVFRWVDYNQHSIR